MQVIGKDKLWADDDENDENDNALRMAGKSESIFAHNDETDHALIAD